MLDNTAKSRNKENTFLKHPDEFKKFLKFAVDLNYLPENYINHPTYSDLLQKIEYESDTGFIDAQLKLLDVIEDRYKNRRKKEK